MPIASVLTGEAVIARRCVGAVPIIRPFAAVRALPLSGPEMRDG